MPASEADRADHDLTGLIEEIRADPAEPVEPVAPTVVRVPASRGEFWTRTIAALAVILAFVFWLLGYRARENLRDDLATAEAGNGALAADVDQLRDDYVEATGQQPAVPPPEETLADVDAVRQGEQGRQGERGEQGPIGETGPPGPEGKMGATGPVGPPGAKGDTGERGEQGDTGETGADGAPCDPAVNPACQGPAGADGRGIASQECVDGDYVTTYTDGTQQVIADSPVCPNGPPITLGP